MLLSALQCHWKVVGITSLRPSDGLLAKGGPIDPGGPKHSWGILGHSHARYHCSGPGDLQVILRQPNRSEMKSLETSWSQVSLFAFEIRKACPLTTKGGRSSDLSSILYTSHLFTFLHKDVGWTLTSRGPTYSTRCKLYVTRKPSVAGSEAAEVAHKGLWHMVWTMFLLRQGAQ